MKVRRPAKDTQFLRKNDEDFMKKMRIQNHARAWLLNKLKMKIWTKEEFIEHCKKRGYLKTPTDKKILEDVLRKAHLSSRPTGEPPKEPPRDLIKRSIGSKREAGMEDYKPL